MSRAAARRDARRRRNAGGVADARLWVGRARRRSRRPPGPPSSESPMQPKFGRATLGALACACASRRRRRRRRADAEPPARRLHRRQRRARAVPTSSASSRPSTPPRWAPPIARWRASTASTAPPATAAASSSRWRCCARTGWTSALALQRLPVQAAQHPGDDDQADRSARWPPIKDNGFPWQQDYADVVVGYNAYSPLGRRDRPGRLRQLRAARRTTRRSTSSASACAGKIVLVRYGQNFRGVKAHLAEKHGAKGVIIYSDPEDDGFVQGPGLSGRPVAPGGRDPARVDPVPLGLPG